MPLSITVDLSRFSAAFAGAQEAVSLGLVLGMEKIGDRGVGLVVENTPVGATGQLAHTVFPHLETTAEGLTEIISNGPPADVYAAPVNDGSRPHFPPYEALIPWVINKFGATDEKTARSIAFLIARKISRQGTPPRGQYDKAYEVLLAECAGILELSIAEQCAGRGF